MKPLKLLTARELREAFGVTVGWVYTRTKKDAVDPLPVVARDSVRSVQDFHLYPGEGTAPGQCYAAITQRKCPNRRKGAFQIEEKTSPDRQCPVA